MTAYSLTPSPSLLSLAAKETKEKRQKVLAGVRHRRRVIYKNYLKKVQRATTSLD